MKSSNERLDELFRSVKEAPIEVEISKVEGFVSSLPEVNNMPADGANGSLNLKIISMISLPLLVISVLYLFQIPEVVSESSIDELNEGVEVMVDTIDPDILSLSNLEIDPISTLAEFSALDSIFDVGTVEISGQTMALSSLSIESKLSPKQDLLQPSRIPEMEPSGLIALDQYQVGADVRTDTMRIPEGSQLSIASGTPPPELSNRQMKQLKKSLYSNLYSDGLIPADTSTVYIKLPGSQVMINGERLNEGLATAYSKLTTIAGFGEHRAIKLSPDLILVGDFVGDDFKGSGVGLFPIPPIDTSVFTELERSLERLGTQTRYAFDFSDDWNNLNEFAEKVLAKTPEQIGKKRLLSVDLDGDQMSTLYEMLQRQLLEDNLIESETDWVILGIGERTITFNGKEIPAENQLAYRSILKTNRIKSGANRMIRISDKVIGVGDFKPGAFKGTIWKLSN